MSDSGIDTSLSGDPSGGEDTEDADFQSLLRRVAGTAEKSIAAPLLPGAVIDEKLRVERILGRGGMGAVYLARHLQLSRDVALKVTFGGVDEQARQRLLREAQAMAAITHDNVVTVYDVGTVEGQVFIAMEFVDGGTLRTWLAAQPRTWREILGVYVKAGRGLAAAHRQGMVHRDFKPDNVLIGDDGRVRVADFGLARAVADAPEPVLDATDEEPGAAASAAPPQPATDPSLVVGTPAYMAFEQFSGMPPTERTDQFAFCVSLFEALFGRRPYRGTRSEELVASMAAGRIVEPPKGHEIPQVVRRAVLRGLSIDPGQRFASMDDLLRELHRATARRGRLVGGAVALVVLSASAAWALTDATETTCEDDASLRDVWNDATRADMRAEILESKHPKREEVWRRTEGMLDTWVSEWEDVYLEACTAAPAKRQIALSCLAARRNILSELVTRVEAADAPRAVGIVANGLESVEPCRPVPDPDPTEAVAAANAEEAQQHWIAAVRGYRANDYDAALAELEAIDLAAPGVAGTDRMGLALAMMGDIHYSRFDEAQAQSMWRDAIPVLVANDDIDTAIQTTISLASSLHQGGRPLEEVRMLVELANAWLPRAPGRDWLASKVGLMRARLLRDEGDYDGAEKTLAEALDTTEQAGAPGPYFDLELELARTLEDAGEIAEARRHFAALYDEQRAQLPADHPRVLTLQVHLAAAALADGDADEARRLLDSLPAEHAQLPDVVEIPRLRTRAQLLTDAGDRQGASDTFAAGAPLQEADPRPPYQAELALWQARAGDATTARATLERALKTAATRGFDWELPEVRILAARVALTLGDPVTARAQLDRARPALDELLPNHRLRREAEALRARLDG